MNCSKWFVSKWINQYHFFYISPFFRLLFSIFSNRLGETKLTDLSFSVTNLHFSITNLHFSGRLQILREILSSIFNKKDNCPTRDLNLGWLDHKQLSYPLYQAGVMKSRLRNIDNKDYIFLSIKNRPKRVDSCIKMQ